MRTKDHILLEEAYIKNVLLKEQKDYEKPFYDIFLKYVKLDKNLHDNDVYEIAEELFEKGLLNTDQVYFYDNEGNFDREFWEYIRGTYSNLIQDFDAENGTDLKDTDLLHYIMDFYNKSKRSKHLDDEGLDEPTDNRSYREIEHSDRMDVANEMDPDQAAEFRRGA